MKANQLVPGVICIVSGLSVMFGLMHYAPFYAESYSCWIGIVLAVIGTVSLVKPLTILWIYNRKTAGIVIALGCGICLSALYWPAKIIHTQKKQKIDSIMPYYSFSEYHEVLVNATVDDIKMVLKSMRVRDIPTVKFLMKIRGAPEEKEESGKLPQVDRNNGTFRTADFNYFVMDSTELITVMLVKTTANADPPEMKSVDEFMKFSELGYIKVALNFRLIPLGNESTLVTTETRNQGLSPEDRSSFGRYWRIIYPGSAIIRRVWLDTLAEKSKKKHNQSNIRNMDSHSDVI